MATQDGAITYEIETPGGGAEYTPDVGFTTVGATPTVIEIGLLMDAIQEFWENQLAPIHGDHWALKRIRVSDHRTTPAAWKFQRVFTGAGLEGAVSGAKLPDQLCLVTSFYTSLGGRSRQGRVYEGGLYQGMLGPDANKATSAYAVLQNAAWEDFNASLSAPAALQAFHAVWSPKLAGGTPVTSYITGERIDVQRRRAPRIR